jgi:hypothetical protein
MTFCLFCTWRPVVVLLLRVWMHRSAQTEFLRTRMRTWSSTFHVFTTIVLCWFYRKPRKIWGLQCPWEHLFTVCTWTLKKPWSCAEWLHGWKEHITMQPAVDCSQGWSQLIPAIFYKMEIWNFNDWKNLRVQCPRKLLNHTLRRGTMASQRLGFLKWLSMNEESWI